MTLSTYEFLPLDLSPEGIHELRRLLAIVWPDASHMDERYLDWAYTRNPEGPALGVNAYEEGVLVAHYAAQPFPAVFNGAEEKGLLSFNTATHPDHRGRGLLPALAKRTYEAAADAGFGFATGAANQLSTRTFVEKVGFEFVRSLDARIGVGPTPRRREGCAVEFSRLWNRSSLDWRLSFPDRPYLVQHRKGRCTVYAATGRLGSYVEMGDFEARLVPRELPRLRAANPLRLWIGYDPGRRWSRSLYVDIPERLRPAPLNWLLLDLTGRGRVPDPRAISIAAVDFDAF